MRAVPGRRSPRIAWLLLAVAACGPRGGTLSVEPAVAGTQRSDGPGTRTALRSCPATGKPRTANFDLQFVIGEAGGVTWLYGYSAGENVLAHLDRDGGLALTPAPLQGAEVGAVAGTRIWLYESGDPPTVATRWASVDVRDPDAPVAGPVVPVKTGAKYDHAAMLAVGEQRAVVIVGMPAERELVLLDPTTNAAIGPPHPLGVRFEPVHAGCAEQRCFVVGITDEGGGPERRLVVIRLLADGTREQQRLAPGWIGEPHAALRGEQVIVSWTDDGGLKLRALDLWGRPARRAVAVPLAGQQVLRDDALLHAGGAVMVAVGERGKWSVAAVGLDAKPDELRELPGAGGHRLVGAPLGEGLAWASVGGNVSYDDIGGGIMTHSWKSQVVGGFLPAGEGAPLKLELVSDIGDGSGGFQAMMLVRPGGAAVLVIPRGDADRQNQPTLTPLRMPCPA